MSETSSTTTASQGGSSSGPLPSGAEVLTAWLKHAAYVRVDGRKYLVLESVPFDDLDTGLAYEELVPFFATQSEVIGLVLVEVPEWEQQKLRAALAVDQCQQGPPLGSGEFGDTPAQIFGGWCLYLQRLGSREIMEIHYVL